MSYQSFGPGPDPYAPPTNPGWNSAPPDANWGETPSGPQPASPAWMPPQMDAAPPPAYMPPAYTPPPGGGFMPAPAAPAAGQGAGLVLGILGLVVGILSIPLFLVPFLDFILGGGGVVLGIFARRQGSRGLGLAALILGIVGASIGVIFTVLWVIGAVVSNGAG